MKFHFPSLAEISGQSLRTFKRFPFVLLGAIAGSLAVVWLIEVSEHELEFQQLAHLAWICALSIPAFLSAATFAESRKLTPLPSLLLNTGMAGLLVLYYFLLPDDFPESSSEAFFRYILFALAAHLLVSFAPFLWGDGDDNHAFWAYNKTLFLRIIMSGLYTGVLFAGLAIALISIENLLEFDIEEERYAQLFVLLLGIFNTWFFLSGVPQPLDLTKKERAYPGGLKVFVQYILIPLVAVYILILYLYTGKIMVQWAWPNGWVANLVLSFSIAGILALLLLHPIRKKSDNRWINLFSKGYYLALIPLLVLLVLSIWVRISEYGVTVNRYFVAALAVWLSGHVMYFLWSQTKNIRVIPISLCVVTLTISFGPWGAFQVSERSQLNRFEHLLETHGMLSPQNTITPAQNELPFDDRKQMSSMVRYLLELDGPHTLQPYFEQSLTEVLNQPEDSTDYYPNDAKKITDLVGIEYVGEWEQPDIRNPEDTSFRFSLQEHTGIPVAGYQYYLGTFHFGKTDTEPREVSLDDGSQWTIQYSDTSHTITLHLTSIPESDSLSLNLQPLLEKLQTSATNQLPIEAMTLEAQQGSLRVKVVVQSLNGSTEPEIDVNFVSIMLFLDSD